VIEPRSELIAVGSELPGVAREVHVHVGENVKVGDALFSLDQRDIDAQIGVYAARVESAKVELLNAKAQFSIVSGIDDARAVSRDDFNTRKYGEQLADTRLKEFEQQLAMARVTKERLTVRAPISGQILEVNIRPGEYVTTGALASPLIRMGDVSTLNVRVEIDEENIARVNVGSAAKGILRSKTSESIPLTFVRFEPYVRPKQNLAAAGQRVDTRVLQVIYALPQSTNAKFVGQFLDVFVDTSNSSSKEEA
jgi:RND family efflux transporter MFP subunit